MDVKGNIAMKKHYLLAFLLSLPAITHADQLEIISLQHRNAEELLPLLQPIIAPTESISGMSNQIILRANEHSRNEIKKLIQQLDVARKQLIIHIIQDADSATTQELTGFSGHIGIGNVGIDTPSHHSDGKLNAHIISTRDLKQQHSSQQIRVVDGGRAFINTGQQRPINQTQIIHDRWGNRTVTSTNYQSADVGFYVRPRLNGNNITLEIETKNNQFTPNNQIDIQQTNSSISGKLGEWILLSNSQQDSQNDNNSINSRGLRNKQQEHNILVKVEEAI